MGDPVLQASKTGKERRGGNLETLHYLTIGIFLVSILFVITGWIDSVLAALLGVMGMIFIGVMTDMDAFKIVDWNVILILLVHLDHLRLLRKIRGPGLPGRHGCSRSPRATWPSSSSSSACIAGLVSMLIDNVVVVLMFAPVVFHACRQFKFPAFPPILFVGLCANFMGTAMLLGDLPPQMLHSVSEDRILAVSSGSWAGRRPSSSCCFPTSSPAASSTGGFRQQYKGIQMDVTSPTDEASPRPHQGQALCDHHLRDLPADHHCHGLPAVLRLHTWALSPCGAPLPALSSSRSSRTVLPWRIPIWSGVLRELDWRAIFFYISLFMLWWAAWNMPA